MKKDSKGKFTKKSETAPVIEEIKETPEAPVKGTQAAAKDLPGYMETLEKRTDLKAVYVGEKGGWFFNKIQAERSFKDGYKVVKNPFFEGEEKE